MSLPSFQYAMYHSLRRHDLTAHLYAGFGRPSSTPSASVLGLANLCTNSFFYNEIISVLISVLVFCFNNYCTL